jgi:gibberellin 2-oxidase
MEAITESLGLGRHNLSSQMKESGFEMMLLCSYPPPPPPVRSGGSSGDDLRCGNHADYTFLSVILASHEGLEELDRTTGVWLPAPHHRGGAGSPPPSLTVHVGDCLEAMSNGRYRAAAHRVLWGRGDTSRVSVANLASLAMDASVEVARELVDDRHVGGNRA